MTIIKIHIQTCNFKTAYPNTVVDLELIQICFQYQSLICLDFRVNNLYFITLYNSKRKKNILPQKGLIGVGGGRGGDGSGGGFGRLCS